jgi:short-subunit dehydrogenase
METIRRQFDTHVIGLLETTKAVLPYFRAQHSGVIVNISSIGGKVTFPLGTRYHGTRFAVEGLSESLSYETRAIGVKVKIVEPGAIKTDFATRSLTFSNDESLVEYQKMVKGLMAAVEPMMANGADPHVVAANST